MKLTHRVLTEVDCDDIYEHGTIALPKEELTTSIGGIKDTLAEFLSEASVLAYARKFGFFGSVTGLAIIAAASAVEQYRNTCE